MIAVHTTDWNAPKNRLRRNEHKGRPLRLVAGSWLADLVSLKKAITLCRGCMNKFDHNAHHYTPRTITPSHPMVVSDCDGCRAKYVMCKLYRHEEIR